MKTKLVLWGKNAEDIKLLITLELNSSTSEVTIRTYTEEVATEDFSQKLMQEWRLDAAVELPDSHDHMTVPLSLTEPLLPEHLTVEKADIIQRAQTEWQFTVLSAKLSETYKSELEDLKEKVGALKSYDSTLWDELKGFWGKVQEQIKA